MLVPSARWKAAWPGASLGVLAMSSVNNSERSAELERRRVALEAELRTTFGTLNRSQLKSLPQLEPYTAYYKQFGKTYHLQHQLESVVFKGKSIPNVAPIVEAMFMAELKNLLLTAGHDLDSIRGGIAADAATGTETSRTLTGEEKTLKERDMFIHDDVGVLSSIIYGPDDRTPITPSTKRILFTVYAPAGIPQERLWAHLEDLKRFVLAVSPEANVDRAEVLFALRSDLFEIGLAL